MKEFCKVYVGAKESTLKQFAENPPQSWEDLADATMQIVTDIAKDFDDNDYFECPDPDNFGAGRLGTYSGSVIFSWADRTGCNVWVSVVSYGSCSGCDAFQAAEGDPGVLWTLGLHVLQNLKQH